MISLDINNTYLSPLKFPLRNWVAQVCLQIQKGGFFVKAQGGRDPGFCRQHVGFVDMLGWNNVIRSNSFFYPVLARGTSRMGICRRPCVQCVPPGSHLALTTMPPPLPKTCLWPTCTCVMEPYVWDGKRGCWRDSDRS